MYLNVLLRCYRDGLGMYFRTHILVAFSSSLLHKEKSNPRGLVMSDFFYHKNR